MFKYRVLLAGVGILLLTIVADAQFPGGGGMQPGGGGPGASGFGGRGGGMRGMGGGDPSMMFKWLSGGKDTINVDTMDERMRMMMDGMTRRMGITLPSGSISQDQFSELMKQATEKMRAGGFAPPGMGAGAPGAPTATTTAPAVP